MGERGMSVQIRQWNCYDFASELRSIGEGWRAFWPVKLVLARATVCWMPARMAAIVFALLPCVVVAAQTATDKTPVKPPAVMSIRCTADHPLTMPGRPPITIAAAYEIELSKNRVEKLFRRAEKKPFGPEYPDAALLCDLKYPAHDPYLLQVMKYDVQSSRATNGDYRIYLEGEFQWPTMILKRISSTKYQLLPAQLDPLPRYETKLTECRPRREEFDNSVRHFNHQQPVEFDFLSQTCRSLPESNRMR